MRQYQFLALICTAVVGTLMACEESNQEGAANTVNTGSTGNWPIAGGAPTGGTGGVEHTGGAGDTGGIGGVEDTGGAGTGGVAGASGGAGSGGAPDVDCSAIVAAGWDLCDSGPDFCAAVFEDGAGCQSVCAAAGLECGEVWENLVP